MKGIFLGLGTNLGSRVEHLACCLKRLSCQSEVLVTRISSVYESEPFGEPNQPWFLNMAVEITTDLAPFELLTFTQQVEKEIGRKETYHWGPRIIDIDILSYHEMVFRQPMLQIPHRQLHLRRFVLLPLKEIATGFVHPEIKKNIDHLLTDCQDKTQVIWFMNGTELIKRS